VEGDLAEFGVAEGHFRGWLRGLGTGCEFASSLVHERKRFYCYSVLSFAKADVATIINALVTNAAADKQPAYFLFPRIRTAPGITRMLETLNGEGGWTVKRVRWRKHRRDAVLLGAYWQTASGPLSSAIGFAPLGTMPVTRRAPFVAIGVWGGGQENQHLKSRPKESAVGVADIPSGHRQKKHAEKMKSTDARVRALLADPAEDVVYLRQVAFCLPTGAVRRELFR